MFIDFLYNQSGKKPWLTNPNNPYIYTLRLTAVTDVFNQVDALWDNEFNDAEGKAIQEKDSSNAQHRLCLALDAHRYSESDNNNGTKRVHKIFTDVVVRIHPDQWNHVARNLIDVTELTQSLVDKHRDAFRTELLYNRYPSYLALFDSSLEPEEVWFQFGRGIFIPAGDQQRAKIEISYNGSNYQSLSNWDFYDWGSDKHPMVTNCPPAIYATQDCLLLANDPKQSVIRAPNWFSHNQGYVLIELNLLGMPNLEATSGQIQTGEITKKIKDSDISYECTFNSEGEKLVVKITSKERLYNLDNTNVQLSFYPRLEVIGLLLPKMEDWKLNLNRDGNPGNEASGGPILESKNSELLRNNFHLDHNKLIIKDINTLDVDAINESRLNKYERINDDEYYGILFFDKNNRFSYRLDAPQCIATSRCIPLDENNNSTLPVSFLGRDPKEDPKHGKDMKDFPIIKIKLFQAFENQISRLQLKLEFIKDHYLKVTQCSRNVPIYILEGSSSTVMVGQPKSDFKFKKKLPKLENDQIETLYEYSETLKSGEYLLFGYYLMRYIK